MKGFRMTIEYINPESMASNPAFTQAISVSSPHKTVYIGGQNGVDKNGAVVGKGDFKKQVEQLYENLKTVLDAAGARPEHVVKWTIYVVQGQSIQEGLEAFQKVWGNPGRPPTITVAFVAALGRPDILCEIDAIAVVPE
jgi:enamine deaminase RidA (YjgF/YER057c/UK114 family)